MSTTQTGNLYTGHTREKYEEYMMRMMIEEDAVNHPQHYNQAGIECIDAIKAATDEGFEYYLQGNILKYLWRYRYKNCLLYTSPSPRDLSTSRMPSSA